MRDDVAEPREVPKPVEVGQRARVEIPPSEALPKTSDITTTAMGQWAGGPPKDKRRVVVNEGSVGGRRQVRPETVVITPVAMSTDAGREEGPRSADNV